jgi:hypothetical protein
VSTSAYSPTMPIAIPHRLAPARRPDPGKPRLSASPASPLWFRPGAGRPTSRVLIRPQPGFYVLRLRSGAPWVAAIIYQLCPMVMPVAANVRGPDPDVSAAVILTRVAA